MNVTNEKKRLETCNEGQEKQDKSSGAVKCSQVWKLKTTPCQILRSSWGCCGEELRRAISKLKSFVIIE